jgi:hypothetical protein
MQQSHAAVWTSPRVPAFHNSDANRTVAVTRDDVRRLISDFPTSSFLLCHDVKLISITKWAQYDSLFGANQRPWTAKIYKTRSLGPFGQGWPRLEAFRLTSRFTDEIQYRTSQVDEALLL